MKPVYFLTLLLSTVLALQKAAGCSCRHVPLTEEAFRKFKYVALVKVTSFQPFTRDSALVDKEFGTSMALFTATTIENFGSPLPAELLMSSYKTSCDLGLREGEEWLIFVSEYKGYPTVHPCQFSLLFKDRQGGRRYRFVENQATLNKLRKWVGRPVVEPQGQVEEYYTNGQKAFSEVYEAGKLTGARTAWYPDGQLREQETYLKGALTGTVRSYYRDGLPEREATYQDGRLTGLSRRWYEAQTNPALFRLDVMLAGLQKAPVDSVRALFSRRQLADSTVYDPLDETVRYGISYDRVGRLRDLRTRQDDIEKTVAYYHGRLSTITLRNVKTKHELLEISWRRDGTQVVFHYDEKGRPVNTVQIQRDGTELVLKSWTYTD